MSNLNIVNIEKVVLSSLLFDNELIYIANRELSSKHFYDPTHQKIYKEILKLYENELPIILQLKGIDELILNEILNTAPVVNIEEYIEQIIDSAVRRELLAFATEIEKIALDDNTSYEEVIKLIEDGLYNVLETQYKTTSISSAVKEYKRRFDKAKAQREQEEKLVNKTSRKDRK